MEKPARKKPKTDKTTATPRVFRDAYGKGFGDRLRQLKLRYQAETGHMMPNHEIADRLRKKLREDDKYTASAVAGWTKNLYVPDTRVIAAIADIFHCDRGWLAFGQNTDPRGPGETDDSRRIEELLTNFVRRAAPAIDTLTAREPVHAEEDLPLPLVPPARRRG